MILYFFLHLIDKIIENLYYYKKERALISMKEEEKKEEKYPSELTDERLEYIYIRITFK